MTAPAPESNARPVFSGVCGLCGDRLGVYEPVVHEHQTPGERTSLAADPTLADGGVAVLFHASCYTERAPNPLRSP
jgi:hypothetical protein